MSFVKHTLSYFFPELRASLESPSVPLSAFDSDVKTTAGVSVTEEKSLAIGAVFACVKVISETIAQMDLEVVERVGKTTKTNTSHPNYWLLHAEPSPYYNSFEWKQGMMAWALMWGNGYSVIKRDRFANAKELKIYPASDVTPKMTERGLLYYEIEENGKKFTVVSDDVIHLKGLSTNGLLGLSPIQIQRENLANAIAKINHEGAFYSNGAKASGILMTPGTMGNKEQKNLKESFEKEHSDSKKRFKTIILEEGVKYQQLTIPQNDAQFLESKKFEQTEIAGWFRVPPHMIGNLQDANYSNIDAQDRAFAKSCIVPWATRFQQELDRKLFFNSERGKIMTQFNLDDLIKGDMKARYETYQIGINGGFIKPIWATEAEGWPTENAQEIDNFFMNASNKSVKQILTETAQNQNVNAA
jgi:HK97 family phage portal protein